MRLYELHQVGEDVGEQVAKAVAILAMAAAAGAVALGFSKGEGAPDVEAETARLIQNASISQINRVREALKKKSIEDLKNALDALRTKPSPTSQPAKK